MLNNSLKIVGVIMFSLCCSALGDTESGSSVSQDNKSKDYGFDISQIDTNIKPGDDFYQYAVGNWLKSNTIPPEYSRWGTFNILQKKTESQLKILLKDLSGQKNLQPGSIKQKVRDFYLTGIDQKKADALGIKPLESLLNRIEQIKTSGELVTVAAELQTKVASPMFSLGAEQDLKDSGMMILGIWQGGIGLPYKEYYLSDSDHSKKLRADYKEYIISSYKLLCESDLNARKYADTVIRVETEFAKFSRNPVELRDPHKNYNPMTEGELLEKYSDFNWKLFFKTIGVDNLKKVNVGQPEFFENINKMVTSLPMEDWKIYLKWTLIRSASPYLSKELVESNFDFYGRDMEGTEKLKPLWKRVVSVENSLLGEALGKLYVEKYFPPENKEKAEEIVHNLLKSMKNRIEHVTWMTDATKKNAMEKLSTFKMKIGYPDKWIDYSGLQVKNDSYIQNVMRGYLFNFKRDIDKVGKPTDRSEWHMNPQTVNAYYSPCNNEIVFPAAILQPPFFNVNADDAINYGSMGVVIGHEITHGFDDQGAKFDKNGNMNEWWTKKDREQFDAKTEKLVRQYDKYEPVKGYHVNGRLTLGENIADLGGLTVSYDAFKMTKEYKDGKKIDGFTPTQRFFLGLAQMWRYKIREQAQILHLKDVHSPPKYRVNGSLVNFEPFYEAFKVKEGEPMYKKKSERIVIW